MVDEAFTNRLINEKSPYLLQHAHNPVDWYPWGDEAFEKAKREDKPVFLSIGYSTCHWCHVMARESFEDKRVADALNRDFVSVKVDREERPDVDAVYMEACQAMTGAGGWPLTVLMTPEQKPFWVGTYLPKTGRDGMPGLLELLDGVQKQWKENRAALTRTGDMVADALGRKSGPTRSACLPGKQALHDACAWFESAYDARWGGFGGTPKFPAAHNLIFLLRYAEFGGADAAQRMAVHTLEQMARGGLYDHIGGGFCRYSTDKFWLRPHFEKMLCDNALLATAYLEAFRRTGRPFFDRVAEQTLEYALRELTVGDGETGFFCGQDADSGGAEGTYYVFTRGEIEDVLGPADGGAFCRRFGIGEAGASDGESLPNLLGNPRFEEEPAGLAAQRAKLYEYRRARRPLRTDDKVLTSWNGLMIASLANAARMLGRPRLLDAAQRSRHLTETRLTGSDGRILHRWRDGEAAGMGQLDDYAFFALALLELYRATFDVGCLSGAADVAEQMLKWFYDEEQGGFFLTPHDGERLLSRPKEVYDGAMPSGNAAAALALVRLAALTDDDRWRQAADAQLRFLAGSVNACPAAHCGTLLALMERLAPAPLLVCATARTEPPAELASFLRAHSPDGLLTLVKTARNGRELASTAPFTADYPVPARGEVYYFCRAGACAAPVGHLDGLQKLMESKI